MNKMLHVFLKNESGQTTTEYVLILAVVVTIFMQFRGRMLKIVKKLFDGLDEKTNKAFCEDDVC